MKQFRDSDYWVSSEGVIYKLTGFRASDKRPLHVRLGATGYLEVQLRVGGKRKRWRTHRVVCECYHSNPEGKPYVNHKDGIKTNNHPDNLEWVTPKENSQHASDIGLLPDMIGVKNPMYGRKNPNTSTVVEGPGNEVFETVQEAAEKYRVSHTTIRRWCENKMKPDWRVIERAPCKQKQCKKKAI